MINHAIVSTGPSITYYYNVTEKLVDYGYWFPQSLCGTYAWGSFPKSHAQLEYYQSQPYSMVFCL